MAPRCRAAGSGLAVLLATLAAALPGQETLEVKGPSPATVKLGDTSQVELTVEGSAAAPRDPVLPKVDGLQFDVSPGSRQSYTFFDGRTMSSRNTVQFTVFIRPLREGHFTVPPIVLWTGTKEQQTAALQLDAVKDMHGEELGYLAITIAQPRVYVHEPIRVRVEFGVDAGLRGVTDIAGNRVRYFDYEVQAPWLQKMEGAEPIELPEPTNNAPYVVVNRTLQRAECDPAHDRGGKRYQSFVFERAWLPTRTGKFVLSSPLLRYHILVKEGRGIFGERLAEKTENYYVYGKPLTVEVLPIPEAGRPTPYYGAVGRFQISAALDRDAVKVGSSVKLVVTIRGTGNLEFLRAPEFADPPGFHKLGQTEKRSGDTVTVTYDLTPLDATPREVPPVHWNYFDTTPGVETFRDVATAALPITVRPLEKGESLAPLPDAAVKAVTPGVDDVFDLHSLQGEPVRHAPLPLAVAWSATVLPWLLVAAGALLAAFVRRRAADVLGNRARGAMRALERSLAAGGEPTAALAAYVADRLGVPPAAMIGHDAAARLVAAGADAGLAAEVQQALDAGTAARYAGGGAVAALDAAAVRALAAALAAQPLDLLAARRGAGRALLVLAALLPLLVAAGAAPRPQGDGDGVAAYRRGDYRQAALAFETLAAAGDRRAFYDLGNACFRLGDFSKARWAYECARLGLPRDADLLANLLLCKQRLELGDGDGEPFLAALAGLRDALHPAELLWLGAVLHGLAAAGLVLGRRRRSARIFGGVCLLPALLISAELLWLQPSRPPRAVLLQRCDLVAEPRQGSDLAKVATLAPGVAVDVLGRSDAFVLVRAADRRGYAPAAMCAEVR